jgi:uncharacterized protein YbjQ (UPF0145 family)
MVPVPHGRQPTYRMEPRPADDILSPATLARLRASVGGPGVRPVFSTSGMPADLAALAGIGFEPVGAVQGSSVHHVGILGPFDTMSGEVPGLTRSLYTARRYAMARLVRAAEVVGAGGVIDVTVEATPRRLGPELLEVVAAGTAVRSSVPNRPRPAPVYEQRRAGDEDVTVTSVMPAAAPTGQAPAPSDTSGVWSTALGAGQVGDAIAAGLAPVAVVFGTCVHHLASRPAPETEWPGQEVPGWTQAVADAREVALARLQAEAQREGADGVVGLTRSELDHGWNGQAVEYLAVASALRRL